MEDVDSAQVQYVRFFFRQEGLQCRQEVQGPLWTLPSGEGLLTQLCSAVACRNAKSP